MSVMKSFLSYFLYIDLLLLILWQIRETCQKKNNTKLIRVITSEIESAALVNIINNS